MGQVVVPLARHGGDGGGHPAKVASLPGGEGIAAPRPLQIKAEAATVRFNAKNAEGTQSARRGFADFASEFFATFALKRGVRACFNAKSAKGGARRDFALRFFSDFLAFGQHPRV